MKQRILQALITFLILMVLIAAYLFLYEPPYGGLIGPTDHTLIFAHRGFGNHAPDNSLIGARMAMKAEMDGIDVDGQRSEDGQFMIFHDLSVDRLTTDTGRVSSKTEAQLRMLDLAKKFGKGFKSAPVASFEDFLQVTKEKGILMAELKVTGAANTGLEERAVEIVKKYDAFENVYFSSFNPIVLYRLKKLDPRIRTVLIFMDTNWNEELLREIKPGDEVALPWWLQQEWIRRAIRKIVRPDLLSVNHEVDPATINTLLEHGWPVFLWTIDDEAGIKAALDLHPYGIISDEPATTKKLRDASLPSP